MTIPTDRSLKPARDLQKAEPRSVAVGANKLGFVEPEVFHGTVLRTAGGAAGGALLAGLLGLSDPLMVALITGGALAAAAARGKNWLQTAIGGGLGLFGAGLHALCTPWPWLGALLIGATAAPVLAKGEAPGRMALTGVATGMFTFLGLYVTNVLHSRGILVGPGLLPAPLATAVAGSAAGLFIGLGSAPRHVQPAEDPVVLAYVAALQIQDGEIHEILKRASTIYGAVRADLAARTRPGTTEIELAQRVSDLSMRILHIASQCRTIERDLGTAPASELEERINALQKKADTATDESAKATFLTAMKSLDGQRQAVEQIGRGLERVVARLHANVALLEKVRFSLVHARSADAERVGGEASPLTEAIEELSRELDVTSAAVGEVYSVPAEPPTAAPALPPGEP